MLKVVVIEDELRSREGIVKVINKHSKIASVIGVASDGKEGLKLIRETRPDVVISDIKMPNMTGLEMIEELIKDECDAKFILLTGYAEFEYARNAIKLNVESYLLKPIVVDDIINELNRIEKKINSEKNSVDIEDCLKDYLRTGSSKAEFMSILKDNDELYMDKVFDIGLIYVPFFIVEKHKHIKNQIREIVLKYFSESKTCIISGSSVLLLNFCDDCEYNKLLRELQTLLHKDIGLIYKSNVRIENIYEEYYEVYKNLFSFIEVGTKKAICLNDTYKRHSLDSLFVDSLIRNLNKSMKIKDYEGSYIIISKIFAEFEGKDYFVDDVVYYINSIWSIIVKESKEVLFVKNDKKSFLKILDDYRKCRIKEEYLSVFSEMIKVLKIAKMRNEYSLLVSKTLNKINKEYMNPISLQEIANQLGVTHIYLSKLFHDEIGEGFKDYLIRVRMEEAMYLLQVGDYKVSAVAKAVGYPNPKYFCTLFKKHTGVSPSNYKIDER